MLEVMPVPLGWMFHSSICWHTSPASSYYDVLMLLVFLYPTSLSLLNSELICRSYGSFGFPWSILVFVEVVVGWRQR